MDVSWLSQKKTLEQTRKDFTTRHWNDLGDIINNDKKDWGLLRDGVTPSYNSKFVDTVKSSINGIKAPSRAKTFASVKKAILNVLDKQRGSLKI